MKTMLERVIITGVTGFIGSALAKRLLLHGTIVYGVGRNQDKLNELKTYGNFIPILADFKQYGKLHELISDRGFDMFWHLAWEGTSTSVPTYNNNITQAQNIAIACAAAESAITLQCSKIGISGSHYQQCVLNATFEEKSFNPGAYGIVKKCALELYRCIAFRNDLACANIIIPNAFGVGDKLSTAVVYFIKQMLENKPINLITGIYPEDWIYIEDLVDGIIHSVKSSKKYQTFYVGHRSITTFKEKLLTMKSLLFSKSELLFGTYPELYSVDYNYFDLDALNRDTGYVAGTDFAESIQKTAEWVKSLK